MKKRMTKAQREAAQKAALLRRVTDIYSGAQGPVWKLGIDFAIAEILGKVMPALKGTFGHQVDTSYLWMCHNVGKFDCPETATEFLFNAGIRA